MGGDSFGGSHISALRLVGALDPARYQPIIVLHGTAGRLGEYISDLGLGYEVLSDLPILAPNGRHASRKVSVATYLLRSLPAMRRFLRENSIDIVHTNDGRMHVNWALASRSAGCRLVWHHRQDPSSFGVNAIAPFLANRIVTVSEFSKPARPLWPVAARTTVVHSPFDLSPTADVDAASSRKQLLSEIGAADDALLLGYFGTLEPRKRPLDFVRTVAETTKVLPDRPVHGLLFGEATVPNAPLDREAAELAEALGIEDHVHLMGFRKPIAGPMAAMDASLVSAENEPFGRTLIEAMHLQVPVIATRSGGNLEAIVNGENGLLVDLGDCEAMARAVARLTHDPGLRQKIVANAACDLEARYGADRHVTAICQIYDSLCPVQGAVGPGSS